MTTKKILLAIIISGLYFMLLFLNYHFFKLDFVLIGFFQELLTIPMLLLQFVLLFYAVKFAIRDKFSFKKSSVYLLLFLLIVIFLIGFFSISKT